jgi:hypothetical protein
MRQHFSPLHTRCILPLVVAELSRPFQAKLPRRSNYSHGRALTGLPSPERLRRGYLRPPSRFASCPPLKDAPPRGASHELRRWAALRGGCPPFSRTGR